MLASSTLLNGEVGDPSLRLGPTLRLAAARLDLERSDKDPPAAAAAANGKACQRNQMAPRTSAQERSKREFAPTVRTILSLTPSSSAGERLLRLTALQAARSHRVAKGGWTDKPPDPWRT